MSFVKGWGPDYNRKSIKETPCWIEVVCRIGHNLALLWSLESDPLITESCPLKASYLSMCILCLYFLLQNTLSIRAFVSQSIRPSVIRVVSFLSVFASKSTCLMNFFDKVHLHRALQILDEVLQSMPVTGPRRHPE